MTLPVDNELHYLFGVSSQRIDGFIGDVEGTLKLNEVLCVNQFSEYKTVPIKKGIKGLIL